jgi:AraC-like DNA-binding protein
MQTTLARQETGNRTNASEYRRETAPFKSESFAAGLPVRHDANCKTKNSFTAPGSENGNGRALVEAMVNSKIYQDYEQAFSEATGLPVALRAVDSRQLPHHGGMCDTAVPVRLGDQLIGFLQTGQVFPKKPAATQFDRTASLAEGWDTDVERNQLDHATKQHQAAVKLLAIFAQHLSLLSNQVVVQQENSEPPVITRAKAYIHEHQAEELSLGKVAKAVNTSTFYFCKMFKKATGINFTDYLSRVRIEKSKNLLLNPNLRVSEIAFEVGFQSLTHFNRVFKKILGQSPTEYRANLVGH